MATTTSARKKTTKARKAVKKTATRKKTTAKKTAAKKTASKKTAAKKTAAKKTATKKKTARKTAKTTARKKTPAKSASKRSRSNVMSGPGLGSAYKARRGEEYMSKDQLEHFRQKLLDWKKEILEDVGQTINNLKDDSTHLADPNDRATQESEFALELRTRDRELKLLKKINQALARIADGSYGYCEETGEEIGVARLEIRPVATLCVEAQERRERAERGFADSR